MCTPVEMTIASTLLSGAGTYMQSSQAASNAKRAQQAKNQVLQDSTKRQQAFADEAQAAYKPMVEQQGAEGFTNKLADSVMSREQAFNANRIATPDYSFDMTGAPKNVMIAQEQAFGKKGAETQRNTDALAKLGAYGETQSNQSMDRNAYARAFGNLSDKASGDIRLLPNALNAAANNSQKSGGFLPMLLKGVGSAGTMYGAAGMPGFGELSAGTKSLINGTGYGTGSDVFTAVNNPTNTRIF